MHFPYYSSAQTPHGTQLLSSRCNSEIRRGTRERRLCFCCPQVSIAVEAATVLEQLQLRSQHLVLSCLRSERHRAGHPFYWSRLYQRQCGPEATCCGSSCRFSSFLMVAETNSIGEPILPIFFIPGDSGCSIIPFEDVMSICFTVLNICLN